MINSSGWTAASLIPKSIQDAMVNLGLPQPHLDPNALAAKRELVAEGYRTAPELFRKVPVITPAAPASPINPVPSVPASNALLARMFGGQMPTAAQRNATNWSTGNFQVSTPAREIGVTTPAPSLAGSGWTSPTLNANGFYGVPKVAQPGPMYPQRPNAQPF